MNRRHFLKLMAGGIVASAVPLKAAAIIAAIPASNLADISPELLPFSQTIKNLNAGDYVYSYIFKLPGEDVWKRHIKGFTVEQDGDSLTIENEFEEGTIIANTQLETELIKPFYIKTTGHSESPSASRRVENYCLEESHTNLIDHSSALEGVSWPLSGVMITKG